MTDEEKLPSGYIRRAVRKDGPTRRESTGTPGPDPHGYAEDGRSLAALAIENRSNSIKISRTIDRLIKSDPNKYIPYFLEAIEAAPK